jgi:hypothetical protein
VLTAHPGKVAGAATRDNGLAAHRTAAAYPPRSLPRRAPVPEADDATPRRQPGIQGTRRSPQFHAWGLVSREAAGCGRFVVARRVRRACECCAWAMTARPASVSDVGSGQRPFLRDAFAEELRVDVRQPEDNRRDQHGQCNALGIDGPDSARPPSPPPRGRGSRRRSRFRSCGRRAGTQLIWPSFCQAASTRGPRERAFLLVGRGGGSGRVRDARSG